MNEVGAVVVDGALEAAHALRGRRVIVTGASSGIGRAVAISLLRGGADVVLLARRLRLLEELAGRHGGHPLAGDVSQPDSTAHAVGEAVGVLGGLDAVVHCAGIVVPGPMQDGNPDEWRRMLETNVLGLLHVSRATIPHLRGGRAAQLITVSSMAAHRLPGSHTVVYSASKTAAHVITQGLRSELGALGIRVTAVTPGFVETPLLDDVPESRLAGLKRHSVAGLRPEDVADQIVHVLTSPPSVALVEVAVVPSGQL